ncbi:MAG: hypothetical protein IT290_11720 [Deltaproteobacteria bacterium]|nr:hypothetical protein [Deltaproteobacteria bacterium]
MTHCSTSPERPHAAATPIAEAESCDAIVEGLAQNIVRRRLEVPALLFLESHKPLSTILFTTTLALEPMGSMLFSRRPFEILRALFEDRSNADRLMARIEHLVALRDTAVRD